MWMDGIPGQVLQVRPAPPGLKDALDEAHRKLEAARRAENADEVKDFEEVVALLENRQPPPPKEVELDDGVKIPVKCSFDYKEETRLIALMERLKKLGDDNKDGRHDDEMAEISLEIASLFVANKAITKDVLRLLSNNEIVNILNTGFKGLAEYRGKIRSFRTARPGPGIHGHAGEDRKDA